MDTDFFTLAVAEKAIYDSLLPEKKHLWETEADSINFVIYFCCTYENSTVRDWVIRYDFQKCVKTEIITFACHQLFAIL